MEEAEELEKKKKKNAKYLLKCECVETDSENGCRHVLTEAWECAGRDDVLRHLIEYLDILHYDWVPYEPTKEGVAETMLALGDVDSEFVQNEFERLHNGWMAWREVSSRMDEEEASDDVLVEVSVWGDTTIGIERIV